MENGKFDRFLLLTAIIFDHLKPKVLSIFFSFFLDDKIILRY